MSGDGNGASHGIGEDAFVGDDSSYDGSFDTVDSHDFNSFMEQSRGLSVDRSAVGQPVGQNAMAQALDDPATGGNGNGILDGFEFDQNNHDGDNQVDMDDIAPNDPNSTRDRLSREANLDGADRVDGDGNHEEIETGRGNDTVYANGGDDVVYGQWGHDWISGGDGDDILFGGANYDTVRGNAGDDMLFGGGGTDSLVGGSGHDYLSGNAGDDIYRGGSGRDVFAFNEGDGNGTIVDFTNGLDKIRIYGDSDDIGDINISSSGADVLLAFDGTTVRIEDTARSEIDASDFIF